GTRGLAPAPDIGQGHPFIPIASAKAPALNPAGGLTVAADTGRTMTFAATLRRDWLAQPRADILAGIVVALALIPEAIGFSIIAGVDPRVGLYASVAIAMVIAFAGGRQGMISAATAAVAVVVVPLVRDHGVD